MDQKRIGSFIKELRRVIWIITIIIIISGLINLVLNPSYISCQGTENGESFFRFFEV